MSVKPICSRSLWSAIVVSCDHDETNSGRPLAHCSHTRHHEGPLPGRRMTVGVATDRVVLMCFGYLRRVDGELPTSLADCAAPVVEAWSISSGSCAQTGGCLSCQDPAVRDFAGCRKTTVSLGVADPGSREGLNRRCRRRCLRQLSYAIGDTRSSASTSG